MGLRTREKSVPERPGAEQTSIHDWFTPARFALLLGLLIIACFPQVIGGSETFFAVDYSTFGYPIASYHRDCFWAGQLPLWNPYSNCGTPFMAQWNTMTLYPFSLFYLLFPLSWSLGVFCLLHLFLGGMGMYFLARRWTGNSLAGAVGGVAFAFNGLTWYGLMWPNNIAALGWMPWVVLAMEAAWNATETATKIFESESPSLPRSGGEGGGTCRAATLGSQREPFHQAGEIDAPLSGSLPARPSRGEREEGRSRTISRITARFSFAKLSPSKKIALAGLVGATQILSGAPEVIFQTWMIVGTLWLAQFIRSGIPRSQLVKRALAAGALVAGLAAAQMLPFLALLTRSQRNTQFGFGGLAMPAYGWANYLVPMFHCAQSAQGLLMQPGQGWTGSYYAGIGALALALAALRRVLNQRVWALAIILLFSLTMALGVNFFVYPFIKHVLPFLGFMRFPIKFVVLATFTFPLLAAYGLNALLTVKPESQPRELRRLGQICIALLIGIAVVLWFAWKNPLPTNNISATFWNGLIRALFLGLIFACIVLILRQRDIAQHRIWQTALILLLWFDVFTHAPNLSPTVTRSVYEPDAIRQFFKWGDELRPDVSRAFEDKNSFWKMVSTSTGNPETDINGQRLALFQNFNLLDHAAKLDGFYSLDLKEFSDLSQLMLFGTNDTSRLRDFLMISHVSNPTNAVDWLTRKSALPLITAGQKPVFLSRTNELSALFDKRFDPARFVCLPEEAREKIHAAPIAAHVSNLHYAPQKMEFEAEAAAPAMVVIAQAFYYPWHAYVDGTRVPLWRANHAFQALEIPSGKHTIRLAYEDSVFVAGVAISLVSLAICAWLLGGRPSRAQQHPNIGGI